MTLIMSMAHYSFACLRCVVPVSMHYILCLVTVCMKELQSGTCNMFKEDRLLVCFWWSICNKTTTLLGVSKAAVSKVMMTYANHGKSCTLKRVVSKNHGTTAVNLTSELSIHLEEGYRLCYSKMVACLRINKEMCIFHSCFHYFVHPLYI